jgi:hypothetical protein
MACRLGRDSKRFMRKPPNQEFEVGTRAAATASAAPALLYLLRIPVFYKVLYHKARKQVFLYKKMPYIGVFSW